MSKLEALEEELYGKEEGELAKRMRTRMRAPAPRTKTPSVWVGGPLPPKKEKIPPKGKHLFSLIIVVAVIIFFLVSAAVAYFLLRTRGKEVELTLHSRGPIEAGEVVTVPITFRNISRSTLREVELVILLPQGSLINEEGLWRDALPRIVKKIDDLSPNEDTTYELVTRLFGRDGEEKKIEAVLSYQPEQLRARFSAHEVASFTIGGVPLTVSIEAPDTLSHGQETEMTIRYTSHARNTFENVFLKMEYPKGFTFLSGDPKPFLEDTVWSLGRIDPGQEGRVLLRGKIIGEEGEVKTFRAGLGAFNQFTREWNVWSEVSREAHLAVAPLSVQGYLEGVRERVIIPGDHLRFSVRYKNNTEFPLKNVTLKVFLDAKPESQLIGAIPIPSPERTIFDFSLLEIGKSGVFDSATRALIWGPGNSAELRDVAPGVGGEFNFGIPTLARPIVRRAADTKFFVVLRSTIGAANIPQELQGTKLSSEDVVTFKVKTKILFAAKSLFRASPISNSGPLPPKVGKKTTYAVFWEVRNFINDMKNVEVKTTLPPNVKWENVISPKDAKISFDAASSEVKWKIGDLKAGIGILKPALTGAFQVSITPSEVDVGKVVRLANDSQFSGTDSFTGDAIEEKIPSLSTELREDRTTNSQEWAVVK